MQAATNSDGLTMVTFGIGSPNAATIMDLLSVRKPKGVLFLGKCGGLKKTTEIGHFILPIAAIRGEGTGDDYFPPEVPALPSFKLHKFVSDKILKHNLDYRSGVIYTTNRRVWEHDESFHEKLRRLRVIGIDMETATLFLVGHANEIPRGALLLVSDVPVIPDGVKTEESDRKVTAQWANLHLQIGIEAMTELGLKGENIKHFRYRPERVRIRPLKSFSRIRRNSSCRPGPISAKRKPNIGNRVKSIFDRCRGFENPASSSS
jgi:AMP nucleosidase